jgi:putative ABC transport system permease protein
MKRFLNEFEENIRIAMEQLWVHKMRSLLTALGVIIGIIAVTLMGTAIKGIDKGFSDSLDMLGQDIFYVERWPWRDVGDDWILYRNRRFINTKYADELNQYIAGNPHSLLRLAVPASNATRTVEYRGRNVSGVFLVGTTADFNLINTADLSYGRFFNRSEEVGSYPVTILGYDVADALFPAGIATAIEETVLIARHKFTVIGVLSRQGDFLGMQSFDKQAIMPLSAMRKFHRGNWSNSLRVQALPDVSMSHAHDELVGYMRLIRRLMPDQDNDFEVNRSEALEEQIGPIKAGLTLAGFFITGLALFVGAIGIMNITFVSVRERTREIGTRRALGARRSTILWQFLLEAVAVCLMGGILGLLSAVALFQVLQWYFPNFPFVFSSDLVLIAMVLSIAVGIISGLAPAWQAARLDPANALRHE